MIVIGGGAVGTACARALSIRGTTVLLIDRERTPGEGWRASAGMLAAQVEAEPEDPLLGLTVAGRTFYRENAGLLHERTGIDIGLDECGILQVALTEEAAVAAKAKVAWQRQQAHRADWLSPQEVAEGWPWLASGMGAFWAPEDGVVDPANLVTALRRDAQLAGATIVQDVVGSIESAKGRITGVQGERDRYDAPTVVVAAGAWSGRIAGLPRPLSVEPVRGQMIAFSWPADTPAVVAYGPRCYLLRRGDEMLVGATMEHAGFDPSVTPDATATLIRRASAIHPALRDATPRRAWAGLRPGTPDGLPIIGAEPRLAGLWYATGHGRNGILLAGVTGEMIAQQVRGDAEAADLRVVRPERFWNW